MKFEKSAKHRKSINIWLTVLTIIFFCDCVSLISLVLLQDIMKSSSIFFPICNNCNLSVIHIHFLK